MKNPMSDGEVNSVAFNRLMGDLDHIEADGMFKEENEPQENEGTKVIAHGVSVHIKPMDGEQTKDMPEVLEAPEGDEEESELGK